MEELARKNYQVMLNAIASLGAAVVAKACRRDEATVAKWKASEPGKPGPWELFCIALAALGLKIVPTTHIYVDKDQYDAMELLMITNVILRRKERLGESVGNGGEPLMYSDD